MMGRDVSKRWAEAHPPTGTRRVPLLAPSIMAAVMFALLIGLGIWQLERRTWKLGLLAEIDHAEISPAIPLPADPPQFAKVRIEGRLRPDLQALYGSDVRDLPGGPAIGAQLIEPLERPGQDPVMVVLGWVPTGMAVAAAGTAVEGYIRRPDQARMFSAPDDASKRRFFTLDPAPIAASLGIAHAAPFTLVVMGDVTPGVFPQPATALPRPPNDHLNYALTWFGLALSLAVVFAVYVRKALRA
jgi:surfeit locus 1 family protein